MEPCLIKVSMYCEMAACCDCSRDAIAALAALVSREGCPNDTEEGWCDVLAQDKLENCACVPGVSEREMFGGGKEVESAVRGE